MHFDRARLCVASFSDFHLALLELIWGSQKDVDVIIH